MYVHAPGVREIFERKLRGSTVTDEEAVRLILRLFDASVKEAHDYLLLAESEKALKRRRF